MLDDRFLKTVFRISQIMELIYYPNPLLLAPTKEIKAKDYPDLRDKVREMFEIMYKSKGIGLAAPQVAWSVQLCLINPTLDPKDELILINPKILSGEGNAVCEEGCLSFPGIYGKIRRYEQIKVQYEDLDFKPHLLECSDMTARVIQHEVDHLDNVLLVHRMSKIDKFHNRKKFRNLDEEYSS